MQNGLAFRVAQTRKKPKLGPYLYFLRKMQLGVDKAETQHYQLISHKIGSFMLPSLSAKIGIGLRAGGSDLGVPYPRVASSKPLEPAWKLLWFTYTRYNIKMTGYYYNFLSKLSRDAALQHT